MGNTTTLVSLDYSSGELNGCSSGFPLTQGDITIKNSVFMDTATSQKPATSTTKYLLSVKSLYDVKLTNITLKNMGMKHLTQIEDYVCTIGDPVKVQTIALDGITQTSSNANFNLKLDALAASTKNALSAISLTNSIFTGVALP